MKKLVLFGIFLSFSLWTSAQQLISRGAIFHHLTTLNSLSSNKIVAVLQDRTGFYWVATQDGLNRFDGTNVKIFRKIRGDTCSLSNNHCTDILQDDSGNIWIATLDGLNCYIRKTGKFKRIFLNNPDFDATRINWIRSITEDKAGNIWAAAFGLWRINKESGQVTYIQDDHRGSEKSFLQNPDEVSYDAVLNGIWCNNGDGMVYFDIAKNQFYHRNKNPNHWKILEEQSNFIFNIDPHHVLWFVNGKDHALCFLNLPAGQIQKTGIMIKGGVKELKCDRKGLIWIMRFTRSPILFSPEKNLCDSNFLATVHSQPPLSEVVHSCYNDAGGNYWLCSSEGISIFNSGNPSREYLEFDRIENLQKNTPSEIFTGLSALSENDIWMYDMSGLYHFKREGNVPWKVDAPLFRIGVTGVLGVSDSVIIVATRSAVYRYNTTMKKIEKSFAGDFSYRANMVEDDLHNIWIATWEHGLYKLDSNLKLLHHFTESADHLSYDHLVGVYFDRQTDSVYIGFNEGRGYACVNITNNVIANHKIPLENQNEKNVANTITCFLSDHNSTLWIGTFGGGLFYKNDSASSFQSLLQEDGLKSDFINALVEDDRHNIWVSTSSGINILTNEERVITSAGNEIELPNNDFFQNLRMINGNTIVAFDENKLILYHPSRMLMDEHPGKILISDFSVFGKPVTVEPGNPIQLNYDQNFFSFKFSLLKVDPVQPVLYACKLEGFDKDWVKMDQLHIANYTNVPPGNYVFKVKAAGLNGKWIHVSKDLVLIITPPFWKTGWFILLIGLTVIFSVWSLYRYRVRQLKRVFEVRNKISHDLHDEIGSTLSGVALLSELTHQQLEQHKDEEVKKHLQNITGQAQSMIQKMSDIVWAINPINDSLEKVINKLNNYAVNVCTAAKIQFHLFFDEKVRQQTLNMQTRENIYLFSKEAIHNVIKYSDAKNLYFSLKSDQGRFRLLIFDDGIGFNTLESSNGNGLHNMRARAKSLNAKLNIESEMGHGTIIELLWQS